MVEISSKNYPPHVMFNMSLVTFKFVSLFSEKVVKLLVSGGSVINKAILFINEVHNAVTTKW